MTPSSPNAMVERDVLAVLSAPPDQGSRCEAFVRRTRDRRLSSDGTYWEWFRLATPMYSRCENIPSWVRGGHHVCPSHARSKQVLVKES